MKNNITLLDGATGTRLWSIAQEAGVEKYATWRYNIEHPQFVIKAEREYIDAGSQIILANTFSVNRDEIKESQYSVEKVIAAAVRAAKAAVGEKDVKAALDIGPLSQMLEPYGDLSEDEARDIFDQVISAGVSAGADLIFIETFMDLEMMKIAAREAKKYSLPVFCSMSFTGAGKTLFGNSVEDVVKSLEELNVDAIGLNCSLGPDLAAGIINHFSSLTSLPLIFKPNAGMPIVDGDGNTSWPCDCEEFAALCEPVFDVVSYLGGCCGTDARYIKALTAKINERK